MPSKSKSQHKLMEIAAHTKGGFGGVPQSVGKDFAEADDKAGITKTHNSKSIRRMAKKHVTNEMITKRYGKQ